jgi:hypothetical protein
MKAESAQSAQHHQFFEKREIAVTGAQLVREIGVAESNTRKSSPFRPRNPHALKTLPITPYSGILCGELKHKNSQNQA